jgi:hypothetical protein
MNKKEGIKNSLKKKSALINKIAYTLREKSVKNKSLMPVLLSFLSISLLSDLPAFALGFTRGVSRDAWWYDLGNGNYLKSTWQWLDSNRDGISECYCFDQSGWMYENTITPDGYRVNDSGAWVVNSVVQRKHTISLNMYQEAFERKRWSYKKELLNRINQFRTSHNLRSLTESDSLNAIAEIRAKECAISFSHTRPQGGSILTEADICGEILACNNETPARTVNAWISSAGHNQVMSREDFLRFGSGYYVDEKGNDYWVVLFSYYN